MRSILRGCWLIVPKTYWPVTLVPAHAANNPAPSRPLVFALSRPIRNSECTAAEAYAATGGRVVFASGCLHSPVQTRGGGLDFPQSSSSCYVFPGLALGLLISGAKGLQDNALIVAAEAVAARVTARTSARLSLPHTSDAWRAQDADRAVGAVYPPFSSVRDVSAAVAAAVAKAVYDAGLATSTPRPRDLLATAKACVPATATTAPPLAADARPGGARPSDGNGSRSIEGTERRSADKFQHVSDPGLSKKVVREKNDLCSTFNIEKRTKRPAMWLVLES